MRLESNLDSSPSGDSHACSVTSVGCAAVHFIPLLASTHTHTFLCVFRCAVVRVLMSVRNPRSQEPGAIGLATPALRVIRPGESGS